MCWRRNRTLLQAPSPPPRIRLFSCGMECLSGMSVGVSAITSILWRRASPKRVVHLQKSGRKGSAEVERLLKPRIHLCVHLSPVCVFVVLPALQWKLLSKKFLMLVLQCSTSLACIALSPSINKLQQDWKSWGLPEFGTVTLEPSYLLSRDWSDAKGANSASRESFFFPLSPPSPSFSSFMTAAARKLLPGKLGRPECPIPHERNPGA